MNILFLIIISLNLMGFGIDIAKHGKEQIIKQNWLVSLISRSINITLVYFAIRMGL